MGIYYKLLRFSRILTMFGILLGLNFFQCSTNAAVLRIAETEPAQLDFQLLVDPDDAKNGLEDLASRIEVVQKKLGILEDELHELESKWTPEDEADWTLLQKPLNLDPGSDLAAVLSKFSKLKVQNEEMLQLKQKINSTSEYVQAVQSLEQLINTGINDYVNFSKFRSLLKTMFLTSQVIFDNLDERREYQGFCVKICRIQKPTSDLKIVHDFKQICYNFN